MENFVGYNERNVEQRITEIYENFDWETFRKVVDHYKTRFGIKIVSTKEKEEARCKNDELRKQIFKITGIDLPEESKFPSFSFDRTIHASAQINRYIHPHGHITFNPKDISLLIPKIAKNFLSLNIKVDFDLVYLVTIKVLIHELLHKEGNFGTMSVVDEATVESISYIICRDYLNQTGTRTTKSMEEIFSTITNFGFYLNEILVINRLIALTTWKSRTSLLTFRYGIYSSFFERKANFTEEIDKTPEEIIPDKIKSLWHRLTKLKLNDPDYNKKLFQIDKEINELTSEQVI